MAADDDAGLDDRDAVTATARSRAVRARAAAEAAARAADAAEAAALAAENATADGEDADREGHGSAELEPSPGTPADETSSADTPRTGADDEPTLDTSRADSDEAATSEDREAVPSGTDRGTRATRLRRVLLKRPTRSRVLVVAAAVLLAVGVGGNIWLYVLHSEADDTAALRREYVRAAEQGVVNMTTIDFNDADAGVKRVIDGATGEFREDFAKRGKDFVSVIKKAKVATAGEVASAGVEKVNPDGSMVVLVASNSKVSNAAGAQKEDRAWRLRVTVTEESDQLKMSKVEFVP